MTPLAVDWVAIGTSASIIGAAAALTNLVVTLVRERKKLVVSVVARPDGP